MIGPTNLYFSECSYITEDGPVTVMKLGKDRYNMADFIFDYEAFRKKLNETGKIGVFCQSNSAETECHFIGLTCSSYVEEEVYVFSDNTTS